MKMSKDMAMVLIFISLFLIVAGLFGVMCTDEPEVVAWARQHRDVCIYISLVGSLILFGSVVAYVNLQNQKNETRK